MAWNIEVAAIRTDELADAVPDVFALTATTMGFEEATSVMRGPDLCAAKVGDWAVVIDVDCRMSENLDHLVEASASTDLHLVRIADEPIALHYRGGRPVTEARGRDVCLQMMPGEDHDGESLAMRLLHKSTGVDFGEDLWGAKFTLFVLQ